MTANGELRARLQLNDELATILNDYAIYRKGNEIVAATTEEGNLIAVKKMYTIPCTKCGSYIKSSDHRIDDDNKPVCYQCWGWNRL